jgi:hypothetical protein
MTKPSKMHYSQYGEMPLLRNRVYNVIFDYQGTFYERNHANGKPIDLRYSDGVKRPCKTMKGLENNGH